MNMCIPELINETYDFVIVVVEEASDRFPASKHRCSLFLLLIALSYTCWYHHKIGEERRGKKKWYVEHSRKGRDGGSRIKTKTVKKVRLSRRLCIERVEEE